MGSTSLYIVPTPIGNLEDITLRSIRLLKEVDVILAEDTRNTGVLLKHHEISNPLMSYHVFNEHKQVDRLIHRMKNGEIMALVSDAGTPAISDPGFLLVRACLDHNINVECLPGATAFVPALVKSGLPSDSFVFEGFLPHKKGRKTKLEQLSEETRTIVLYESPHRLLKALDQFIEYFGEDRKASISRELTKIHEETINGTLSEIKQYYESGGGKVKGEIVVVISGSK
ncbi:MAG: 16S rRNA (cytidine(1402)-2'-O)-methyltransferase [Cyclobacteriaceae bacterium]|nr:16S rRNA (cytidine(1402)-2'-O)-methyltransferase [Cyclobacteriaceae bacterium]